MTKKEGHQKFSALKWIFFLNKVIQIFPSPQTRRQVSAYAFIANGLGAIIVKNEI